MSEEPSTYNKQIEQGRSFVYYYLLAGLPASILALLAYLLEWRGMFGVALMSAPFGFLLAAAVSNEDEFAQQHISWSARKTILALGAIGFFNIPGFSDPEKFWSLQAVFIILLLTFNGCLWFRRLRG